MSNPSQSVHSSPLSWPRAIFVVALVFAAFQITTSAVHVVSSQVLRAVHVGFVLLMVFLVYPARGDGRPTAWSSILLGVAAIAGAAYQWIFEADLIQRSGVVTTWDMVIGLTTLTLVFEAARRVMGVGLPLICLAFLLYALFGEWLPGMVGHRGYGFDQVVNQLAFGTEGIYGTPTYVSATYIFLFILFGSFLERAGMINLFSNIAMGMFGHRTGGPAKVCVASSALMGTISGSGIANVVASGQFTIPLMKRYGYSPAFAGGIEASSSMGGQIMPPVMGAVAFIMAETINIPYMQVAKAALVPALLYMGSIYWMVHLEAKRLGMRGMPRSQTPDAWQTLRQRWYLMIPLIVLIAMLFAGFTPILAGGVGLLLTAIVILGSAVALRFSHTGMRVAFWIAVAFAASAGLSLGVTWVFGVVGTLAGGCLLLRQGGHDSLRACVEAMAQGVKHALPVAAACALVGVIVGALTLTGSATLFAGLIIEIGRDSLLLSLMLTMVVCLILGMGIPTIPNYIITSAIAAPALLALGVPLLVSHMFVFYFGILADLTPPVALACFAAAPMAQEKGLKISFQAVRTTLAGFIVPYMAVYEPALMLQGDDYGRMAYLALKVSVAVAFWGIATIGFWRVPLMLWERAILLAAGGLMVVSASSTDEIGFALGATALVLHWHRSKQVVAGDADARLPP